MAFYKVQGESLVFTGKGELIYFIPEKYFDVKAATTKGEYVDTIGVFTYHLYDDKGKLVINKVMKAPTMISCRPYNITTEKGYLLRDSKEPQDYRCLHFKEGDLLLRNVNVPKDVHNAEIFMNLLIRGNLPDTIPYTDLYDLIINTGKLNDMNFKVSASIVGILISELYRDKNNLEKPFRLANTTDMTAYKAISINKIPKYTSAYTSITSENASVAIASAITTKSKTESPLEKVFMM